MRKFTSLILINIILLISCSSIKNTASQEKIIYVVPDSVQNWFSNVIKSPNLLNKDDVYFIISSMEIENSKAYKLVLCDLDNYIFKDSYFVKNTNRYLYIDKKLYPLLSDLDQIFSVRECCNEDLLETLNSKKIVTLSNTVFYEKAYWVIFDNKWSDIIRTSDESKGGYRTNSPNITK